MTLLLGTNNKGKLRELHEILDPLNIKLVTPDDLGLALDVEEHGSTYAENAALKAHAFARESGLLTLADDSGLEVDALDGAPGLYSARYSPLHNATDADRRAYLLENLKGQPRPWTARFRCVIALAAPGQQTRYCEGICPGEIIPEERGTGGFGYDAIFFLPAYMKTMAELPMQQKNEISHRARAAQQAVPLILAMLKDIS
jgi:XTP/dITP diphosphohydrolase